MNIKIDDLEKFVIELKKQNKKIVFTNGCFDILHIGHIRYLKEAKNLGNILIVGVNSDESVKKLKGDKRPINSELDRAELLNALKYVDHTVIFSEDTPIEIIKKIGPNIHVKGGDYRADELPESKIVKELGGIVVIVGHTENYSTTNILTKLSSD